MGVEEVTFFVGQEMGSQFLEILSSILAGYQAWVFSVSVCGFFLGPRTSPLGSGL